MPIKSQMCNEEAAFQQCGGKASFSWWQPS